MKMKKIEPKTYHEQFEEIPEQIRKVKHPLLESIVKKEKKES